MTDQQKKLCKEKHLEWAKKLYDANPHLQTVYTNSPIASLGVVPWAAAWEACSELYENTIKELENEIDTLERDLYHGD